MNPRPQPVARSGGFTLVELMVSLVVSLLLMSGLIQVFVANKATFRATEAQARLQENSRWAIDYMTKKIRMAGYLGCAGGDVGQINNTLNNDTNTEWNMKVGIEGYDADGTSPGNTYSITATNPTPSGTAANWDGQAAANLPSTYLTTPAVVLPGTDVVIIRGMDDDNLTVTAHNDPANLFVCYPAGDVDVGGCSDGSDMVAGLCEEDILLASDCQVGFVFQTTNLQQVGGSVDCDAGEDRTNVVHSQGAGSPGNSVSSWTGFDPNLGDSAELMKITTIVFFVGQGSGGGPALYRKVATGTPEEIVEGVESMQLLYGEDLDGDDQADRYVPARDVTDFDAVISVRIGLLMRTVEEVGDESDTATYSVLGTTINPVDDRRLRRVLTTTVTLRNRAKW